MIYHCGNAERFLASHVFIKHHIITADPSDTADEVFARVLREPFDRRFLFHLNETCTTSWPIHRNSLVESLASQGIEVLNHRVVDISKRAVMDIVDALALPSVRLRGNEPPDSLVIVKTDANYGGKNERRQNHSSTMLPATRDADNPGGYMVGRLDDFGEDITTSSSLVVQRYVTNSGGLFARVYKVLDRMAVSISRSDHFIKKMGQGIDRQNYKINGGDSVPPIVADAASISSLIAEEMGLDFGTIDIALDASHRAHVIDVNTTPYWGSETQGDLIAHLRQG